MAKMSIFVTEKEERVCENCKYFYQHYIRVAPYRYNPVHAGHCWYPRMKNRESSDSCKYFERRDSNDRYI